MWFDKRAKIKQIKEFLLEGNLKMVAYKKAGVSCQTIRRWRLEATDDRLNKLFEMAREIGQGHRDDMVEDSQFKRLVSGKASGSEYEFYLINRKADRWKKTSDHTPPAGPMLNFKPVINYISVAVKDQAQVAVQTGAQERIPNV